MNRRKLLQAVPIIGLSLVLAACEDSGPTIKTREDGSMYYTSCRSVSDGYQMVYDPVNIDVGAVNMGNGWKMKEQHHTECKDIDVTATVKP